MKKLTLLVIHHEGTEEPPIGSLWMLAEDGRADLLERKLPGWVKLVGPLDVNVATEILKSLTVFFRNTGTEVFDEAIAD